MKQAHRQAAGQAPRAQHGVLRLTSHPASSFHSTAPAAPGLAWPRAEVPQTASRLQRAQLAGHRRVVSQGRPYPLRAAHIPCRPLTPDPCSAVDGHKDLSSLCDRTAADARGISKTSNFSRQH